MDDELTEQELRDLSDFEGSHERMRREQLEMTPEERFRVMDSLCREITLLVSSARRIS